MTLRDFGARVLEAVLFLVSGVLFIFFAAIIWSLVTAAFVCTL